MATAPNAPTRTTQPGKKWIWRFAAGLIALYSVVPASRILLEAFDNDLTLLAEGSIPLDPELPNMTKAGRIVSVSGTLAADRPLGDVYLQPGAYALLERHVEVWAWEEKRQGATVSYVQQWIDSPAPSAGFQQPVGHVNPPRRLGNDQWSAGSLHIGRVGLVAPHLWGGNLLNIKPDQVKDGTFVDDWVYPTGTDPKRPRPGDVRVAYWGHHAGQPYTAIGKLGRNGVIDAYEDARTKLYPPGVLHVLTPGDRDYAILRLRESYASVSNWGRRLEWLGWVVLAVFCGRIALRRPAAH
jgi:hypothetical protein